MTPAGHAPNRGGSHGRGPSRWLTWTLATAVALVDAAAAAFALQLGHGRPGPLAAAAAFAAAVLAVGYWAPSLLTAAAGLLPAVAWWQSSLLWAGLVVLAAALTGGALRTARPRCADDADVGAGAGPRSGAGLNNPTDRTEARRHWALLPLGAAAAVAAREALDPAGLTDWSGPAALTCLGLVAMAAATLAPPDRLLLLLSVSTCGTAFSIAGALADDSRLGRSTVVLGSNFNSVGLAAAAGIVAGIGLATMPGSPTRKALRPLRLVGIALALINAYGLALSQSQGALLAALAGGVVLVGYRRWWLGAGIAAAAGAVAALALLYTPLVTRMGITGRTAQNLEVSRGVRWFLVQRSVETASAAPPWGAGRIAPFPVPDSLFPWPLMEPAALMPHNLFLKVLVVQGVIGLVAAVTAAVAVVVRRGAAADRLAALPLVAVFAVAGLSFEWHETPLAVIPMIALGLLASEPRRGPIELRDNAGSGSNALAATRTGVADEAAAPAA